jgi:hypothetical protein
MMKLNWLLILSTAFIPALIDIIFFHPLLLGKILNKQNQQTTSPFSLKRLLFILFLSAPIALFLPAVVIHQMGIFSMLNGQADLNVNGSELYRLVSTLMEKFGHQFRSFKHGALHGAILALFFVLPLSIIQNRKWSTPKSVILPDIIFWTVSLSLMGGIICAWA